MTPLGSHWAELTSLESWSFGIFPLENQLGNKYESAVCLQFRLSQFHHDSRITRHKNGQGLEGERKGERGRDWQESERAWERKSVEADRPGNRAFVGEGLRRGERSSEGLRRGERSRAGGEP